MGPERSGHSGQLESIYLLDGKSLDLTGEQVCISVPEYDWEKIGYLVNEGAAVLKRNGRIFMTYSASATDHNYAMGLLTADEDSDLLDPTPG